MVPAQVRLWSWSFSPPAEARGRAERVALGVGERTARLGRLKATLPEGIKLVVIDLAIRSGGLLFD